jgi:23S rRNA (uracil747-C5)-methyltransferase
MAPVHCLFQLQRADHGERHSLPGYRIERVQLFDMFPHTAHYEVLTLLVKS